MLVIIVKHKMGAAWLLTAVVLLCPVWHTVCLAGGAYHAAQADTSAGRQLLTQYGAVSVETAQKNIDGARLRYQNSVAAAHLRQSIEEEIAEIEQGNLTYREVFQEVYICGDSLMCGLDSYGLMNGRHLLAQVSAGLSELEGNLPRIISAKPRVLILHYGINAVSTKEETAQRFIRTYGGLIDRIREGSPDTRIIVSLIFPVGEAALARDEKFSGIDRYNELLVQMCGEKEMEYLDSTQLLREHNEYYTADGIHQDREFYVNYWFKHIMREMEIHR